MPPGTAYMPRATRDDWGTPQALFDALNDEFGPFDLDAAADQHNAKCARCYTSADDGLAQPWNARRVWLNPPYGHRLIDWVRKAELETREGRAELVCCLLPARTDPRWFQEIVLPHALEIRFLPGRLRFEGAAGPAPFGSLVVVFRAAT